METQTFSIFTKNSTFVSKDPNLDVSPYFSISAANLNKEKVSIHALTCDVTQLLQNHQPDTMMNILLLLCFASLLHPATCCWIAGGFRSSSKAENPSPLKRRNLILDPEGDYGPPTNVSPCGPGSCWSSFTKMCVSCG